MSRFAMDGRISKQDGLIEKVLIKKLKQGDKDAFSTIFSAYYNNLVLFAINFTHEICSAEEIVQDIFIKIWEERDLININVSLKSYLIKAVQNECIDWFRHLKITEKYNAEITRKNYFFEYDTDNYILRSELESQIDSSIEKLPVDIKIAFCMSRYDGLKYIEIAKKLNVSVRTIEVRISKALKLLHNDLKDYLNFK